jgi:hydroxymethylglutaryl-CoA lyase
LFSNLIPKYPEIEFGAHLHTTPDKWFEKLMQHIKPVVADLMVLFKVGGCPMATDHLTGICPLRSYYRILLHKRKDRYESDEF